MRRTSRSLTQDDKTTILGSAEQLAKQTLSAFLGGDDMAAKADEPKNTETVIMDPINPASADRDDLINYCCRFFEQLCPTYHVIYTRRLLLCLSFIQLKHLTALLQEVIDSEIVAERLQDSNPILSGDEEGVGLAAKLIQGKLTAQGEFDLAAPTTPGANDDSDDLTDKTSFSDLTGHNLPDLQSIELDSSGNIVLDGQPVIAGQPAIADDDDSVMLPPLAADDPPFPPLIDDAEKERERWRNDGGT